MLEAQTQKIVTWEPANVGSLVVVAIKDTLPTGCLIARGANGNHGFAALADFRALAKHRIALLMPTIRTPFPFSKMAHLSTP